jgi:hypothetical protein
MTLHQQQGSPQACPRGGLAVTATLLLLWTGAQQVQAEYVYQVAPCATSISRRFLPDGADALYGYSDTCARTSLPITVGTGGSAGSCSREFAMVLVHFLLPPISAESVVGVSFSATVADSAGGGMNVPLHGLGARPAPISGAALNPDAPTVDQAYPLDQSDYYAGTAADPAAQSVVISESFGASGLADGETITEASAALKGFVRAQLSEPAAAADTGGHRWVALRLGSDSYLGCDVACDGGCSMKRYRFNPRAFALMITVTQTEAPASEWVFAQTRLCALTH